MRKRILHIAYACLLASVLGACTDDSYRGYEINYEEYQMPLTVTVSVGNPYPDTKGTGPKDSLSHLAGNEILVWAFNRDSTNSMAFTRTPSDSIMCLVDGKSAIVDGVNYQARWESGTVYYPYREQSGQRYDFYAGFVDGATILNTEHHKDSVVLVLDIDGSQDLMTSKARLPQFKNNGGDKNYAFSYLSAQEGDDPIFSLRHHLVKIDLEVRPGITHGFTNEVTVAGAHIQSKTRARMTVAARDTLDMGVSFAPDSPVDWLHLTDPDGGEVTPLTLTTLEGLYGTPELEQRQKEETRHLGGSFFVAPATGYLLDVDRISYNHEEPVYYEPFYNTVQLRSGEAFLPGNHYKVTMTVYGEYLIFMDVELVGWQNAGTIPIDTDKDADDEDNNLQ